MSTTLGYLFLLLPVVAVAWIVWTYRRRAVQKEARSREREVMLLGVPVARAAAPGEGAGARRNAEGSGAAPVPVAAAASRRERFLSQEETLAYYLLKAGLPAHEVFPRAPLDAVVALPASQPGAADRLRAGRHDVDFVVCDKSLRVVAAIRVEGRAGADTLWADQRLTEAGVRVIRIDPAALPRRDQVGAIVLGEHR